jgi:hypothetical protein
MACAVTRLAPLMRRRDPLATVTSATARAPGTVAAAFCAWPPPTPAYTRPNARKPPQNHSPLRPSPRKRLHPFVGRAQGFRNRLNPRRLHGHQRHPRRQIPAPPNHRRHRRHRPGQLGNRELPRPHIPRPAPTIRHPKRTGHGALLRRYGEISSPQCSAATYSTITTSRSPKTARTSARVPSECFTRPHHSSPPIRSSIGSTGVSISTASTAAYVKTLGCDRQRLDGPQRKSAW